jgi:Leucine-rich repeat (LRR) protein
MILHTHKQLHSLRLMGGSTDLRVLLFNRDSEAYGDFNVQPSVKHFIREIGVTSKHLTWLRLPPPGCGAADKKTLKHIQTLHSLSVLECYGDSKITTLDVSELTALQYLDCEDLKRLQGLNKLTQLQYLCLTFCVGLTTLDLTRLANLRTLALQRCNTLRMVNLTGMSSAQSVTIGYCDSLEMVFGIHSLTSLQHLHIGSCVKLQHVIGLGALQSLQHLVIRAVSSKELDLTGLIQLQTMELLGCKALAAVVTNNALRSLQRCVLGRCDRLKLLDVTGMTALQDLQIKSCKRLADVVGIETLQSMQNLVLSGVSLTELDLTKLITLQSVEVRYCKQLQALHVYDMTALQLMEIYYNTGLKRILGMNELISLEHLQIVGCMSLTSLKFTDMAAVTFLQIESCEGLQTLDGVNALTSVQTFRIATCRNLTTLDVSGLKACTTFDLHFCDKLTAIHGIYTMDALQRLCIGKCTELLKALQLKGLLLLESVVINNSTVLPAVDGVETLESLKSLQLEGCGSIKDLDVTGLTALSEIVLWECEKLTTIVGIDTLKSLECWTIVHSEQLHVPREHTLTALSKITASSYSAIIALQRCTLPALEVLTITESSDAELNFSAFTNLLTLSVFDCEKLTNLQGLDKLADLQELYVSECPLLERLPHIGANKTLRVINVAGCSQLKSFDDELTVLEGLLELDVTNSGVSEMITSQSDCTYDLLGQQLEKLQQKHDFRLMGVARRILEDDQVHKL